MPVLPDFTSVDRVQPQSGGGAVSYRPNQGPDVGAGIQAGRDLQQAAAILAESNQRQDAVVAQSANNDLFKVKSALEHDPKGGLRSVSGKGVVGNEFVETYTQKFNDAKQAIRESLKSDSQKAMFDRHAEVQALQYQSSLLQHQAVETKRFNDKTDSDTIKNRIDAVSQDPTNINTWGESVAQIEKTTKEYALRNGLSEQSTQELLATNKSAVVVARITALAHGIPGVLEPDPDTAMLLFKMEQPGLTDQAQKALTSDLMQASVTNKAQTMGAELAKQFDYLHTSDAISAIDSLSVPALLKTAIRAEVEHRHAVQQADADKLNAVYMGKIDEWVQKGWSINKIAATPEFAGIRDKGTVLRWIDAKNRQSRSDVDTKEDPEEMGRFYTYYRMATESPETQAKFVKMPLENLIPLLSKAHWNHLVQLQGGIQRGDNKSMNENAQYQEAIKVADSVIKKAGIDTTPKEGTSQAVVYDNFKGALVTSLRQAQLAQPEKPLTQEQMKKVVLEMLQQRIEQGSGVGGWFQTKRLGYEIVNDPKAAGKNWIAVPYSDIPAGVRSSLEAEIRSNAAVKTGMYGTEPAIDKALVERMYQIGHAQGKF